MRSDSDSPDRLGRDLFDRMSVGRKLHLNRIHRQAQDNPILQFSMNIGV